MKITPAKGHYVIDLPETTETSSGLLLADTAANNAPVMGTITAVPEDGVYKVGDVVIFRKYAIDELTYKTPEGEQRVWILPALDILGTVTL